MLERLAGDRPVGHLPDAPPTAAAPRPAGCCSAACWPASTRSTSSCPARSGCTCAATAPTARRGCARSRRWPRASRPSVDRQAAGAALEASAGSASCSPCSRRSRPGCCAAAGSASATRSGWPACCTWPSPRPPGCWSWRYAAGLLDVGGPHRDEWLPTRAYDIWREQDLADRWAVLAAGWLSGVRLPSLVGQRDVAGKAVNPLSPDLVRHTAPAIRRSALTVLAEYPPGAGSGRPTTWSRCCAGAPRGGPTGWRRCPACWPRPPGSASLVGGVLSTAGPRAADRAARTARPTACAGCCPSRSTTCSPSPTSR